MTYQFWGMPVKACGLFLGFLLLSSTIVSQAATSPDNWQGIQDSGNRVIPQTIDSSDFPAQNWWVQLHDDALNQYIQQALGSNPTLKAAISRIDESKALVGEAKSVLLPSLSVQADAERMRTSANISTTTASGSGNSNVAPRRSLDIFTFPLQASYELDLFGKNRLKVQSAKKFQEEMTEDRRVVELSVTSAVAAAYVNLLQADALIQTTQDIIDHLNQSIALRQQLYKGGVIPYDTVLVSEETLAQNSQSLAQYKSQQAVFAHQLSILTNLPPQSPNHLERTSLEHLSLPETLFTGLPSKLLTRRPDVVEAELGLEKANIDVKEARREFFPTLDLTNLIGFSAGKLFQMFDWGSRILDAEGALTQTLFTGGYKTSFLHYQKAVAVEQLNNYRSVLLSAFEDVEDSLSLLKANDTEYQQNLAEIDKAQHFADLANTRFSGGAGTKLDLLDAQTQVLTYQLSAEQNKAQSIIDLVSLYKALGGGYTP
jgi:NodT family efflux transporter outer membrane factor (OMF) lipoprotein